MCFKKTATSVSRRRRTIFPSSPPKIAAVLNLEIPDEREAHDFIRRASTGRWPMWRLLGMRRCGAVLNVAVEWCRSHSAQPYSVVYISLDKLAYSWDSFSTAAEALTALAMLDAKPRPPTTPAAPALMEGSAHHGA